MAVAGPCHWLSASSFMAVAGPCHFQAPSISLLIEMVVAGPCQWLSAAVAEIVSKLLFNHACREVLG